MDTIFYKYASPKNSNYTRNGRCFSLYSGIEKPHCRNKYPLIRKLLYLQAHSKQQRHNIFLSHITLLIFTCHPG